MNTVYNESNKDAFDDARINQLIARYSDVHEVPEEPDDDFEQDGKYAKNKRSPKKLLCTATSSASGRSPSLVQAFPMKNADYVYKIRSSDSDSGKGRNDSNYNIRIICDNPGYNLNTHDSDSSLSKICPKCSDDNALRPKNRVSFQDYSKSVDQQTSLTYKDIPSLKSYAEKTTYCRPIKRTYDKHLLHKVMERNAKLQLLLTKFVIARQKEKEREKWNNYVNSLKIKNHCYRDFSTHSSSPRIPRQHENPLLMNNFYQGKNKLSQSDSCWEMLHDFYGARNDLRQECLTEYDDRKYLNTLGGNYNNQLHCFPSTSRLRRTSKERDCRNPRWPCHRTLYGSSIVVPDSSCFVDKATKMHKNLDLDLDPPISTRSPKVCPHQVVSVIDINQNKDVQTHITFGGYNTFATYFKNELERELEATISENHAAVRDTEGLESVSPGRENEESFYELHEIRESAKSIPKPKMSIEDLEGKLDTLISLFNSFVADLKAKETFSQLKSNERVVMCDIDENQISAEQQQQTGTSKSAKKKKKVTIVGNVMTNTSLCAIQSPLSTSHHLLNTKLNKILYEELDKSNKLRSEIEAMLSPSASRPCAVQMNIDIPTRERSTEVTASLSRTKLKESQNEGVTIEDISSPLDRRIPQARHGMSADEMCRNYARSRIAVNTDPLGFLTLLRFSTEAIKQLLSLVPSVNSWYLRASRPEPACAEYICNICGAAFARPSQLSAHILGHDLGQARDCCVCRHAVDTQRPSQLFRCRYCGQRFTRAYCCELHQQSCARRFGRTHDVGSSLAVLR